MKKDGDEVGEGYTLNRGINFLKGKKVGDLCQRTAVVLRGLYKVMKRVLKRRHFIFYRKKLFAVVYRNGDQKRIQTRVQYRMIGRRTNNISPHFMRF